MYQRIKQCAIGITLVACCFYGIMWFGKVFRAHLGLFALVWFAAPIFACSLMFRSVAACFTSIGMRRLQGIMMAIVLAISFLMFSGRDLVRNRIGKSLVEGYVHWTAEPETGDYGQTYNPGEEWTAKNRLGRWGLDLFEFVFLAAWFGLPAVTWKATNAAILKKEIDPSEMPGNSNLASNR